MNALISMVVGTLCLLVTGVAFAQTGHMMDGGGWGMGWFGGYGGLWVVVLLGAIVGGAVVVLMNRKKK